MYGTTNVITQKVTIIVMDTVQFASKFTIKCERSQEPHRISKSARELLAGARTSLAELCSRVTCVCTTIARVRNTREHLSMYIHNTDFSAREQCKHVPWDSYVLLCTDSSSLF